MELSFHLFRLTFLAPLHLSMGGSELDTTEKVLHSDTLKSALFMANLHLYGEDEFSQRFWDAFQMSSAYPYVSINGNIEYFFPKPRIHLPVSIQGIEGESKQNKKLKGIEYIGKSLFERVIAGEMTTVEESGLFQKGKFVSRHPAVQAQSEGLKVFTTDLQQRVNIRQIEITDSTNQSHEASEQMVASMETDTYYVERYFFSEYAGLYVLIDGLKDTDIPRLETLFRYLGDSGVGKNKQVGMGRFSVEKAERFTLNVPDKVNRWLNLGLYCPQKTELISSNGRNILENSAYALKKRGGWLTPIPHQMRNSFRKRGIFMFEEGSVFDLEETNPSVLVKGKKVDLRPEGFQEHEIWREGRGIFIPLIAQ